jgi:hypothetical protein
VKIYHARTVHKSSIWNQCVTRAATTYTLAYLGLSRLISSHITLFILPAEHYCSNQPNKLTCVVSRST